MARALCIFLTLLIGVANAYCMCNSAVAMANAQSRQQGHECCDHRHNGQTPAKHEDHHCPHCTGALTADAKPAKKADLAPTQLSAFAFVPVADVLLAAPADLLAIASTLPPPIVSPPTLLALGCALNT